MGNDGGFSLCKGGTKVTYVSRYGPFQRRRAKRLPFKLLIYYSQPPSLLHPCPSSLVVLLWVFFLFYIKPRSRDHRLPLNG